MHTYIHSQNDKTQRILESAYIHTITHIHTCIHTYSLKTTKHGGFLRARLEKRGLIGENTSMFSTKNLKKILKCITKCLYMWIAAYHLYVYIYIYIHTYIYIYTCICWSYRSCLRIHEKTRNIQMCGRMYTFMI